MAYFVLMFSESSSLKCYVLHYSMIRLGVFWSCIAATEAITKCGMNVARARRYELLQEMLWKSLAEASKYAKSKG
jgi:hypothetical protein